MAYKLKGIEPGKVYTKKFGTIDFSLPVPYQIQDELYNSGFPYLEKVEEGAKTKKAQKATDTKKEESPE